MNGSIGPRATPRKGLTKRLALLRSERPVVSPQWPWKPCSCGLFRRNPESEFFHKYGAVREQVFTSLMRTSPCR